MIIAIIQARMGSTRLAGKVLKEIDGKPMLGYQLDRALKSKKVDKFIVATSIVKKDDDIEKYCLDYGIDCFRGSEDNVLSRYYECAKTYNPDIVVRITADCPLIDPIIIDKVIEKFQKSNVDYCANTVPIKTNTFPDGSDVEVFSMSALAKEYKTATDSKAREHVTYSFWKNDNYTSTQLMNNKDYSKYRITVDYLEDFKVVEFIFREIKKRKIFGHLDEIIDIIDRNDEIKIINTI